MGFGRDLEPQPSPGLPFFWDYRTEFSRPVLDPFSEAVEAVRVIARERPGPYTVLLSGGIDSQAVLLAFKAAQVPFRALTFSYDGGRNHYDTSYAVDLCWREAIDLDFHSVALTDFHTSDQLLDWGQRYLTDSPHMVCQLYGLITADLPGTVIMGGNPVLPRGNGRNTVYRGVTPWRLTAPCRLPNAVGLFHSYTRELHYSWQTIPIGDLLDGAPGIPDSDPVASYAIKVALYQRGGFDIIPQNGKQHGFEWLKTDIEVRQPDFWRDGVHEYDRLYRLPLEAAMPVSHTAKAIWNPEVFRPHK
jgi:hypothetical protein